MDPILLYLNQIKNEAGYGKTPKASAPIPGAPSFSPAPAPAAAPAQADPNALLQLAQTSPSYQQYLAGLNAASAADLSGNRSALQQALVQFGLVPEGFKDQFGSLDDLTRGLIDKNTGAGLSTYARLLEGRNDAVRGLVNRLSARGLRRSGAKGFGLRRAQLGFDRDFSDAVQKLLGFAGDAYRSYTQNEYQRSRDKASALGDALVWASTRYTDPAATGPSYSTAASSQPATYAGGSGGTPRFDVGGYSVPGPILKLMQEGGF